MENLSFDRTLTELDHVRLTNLLLRDKRSGSTGSQQTLPIEQLLDAADIVPCREVAPDVVTMHSRVLLKDLQTGEKSMLTLCYPPLADASAGFVSVLSPVGWSLLGRRVGCTVTWPTPSGGERMAEILELEFQPESVGQFAV
ncbi:MAG: GreA/GreB family elongation factor [Ideonella sp.]